ncbi:hypothetical protein MMC30_009392 [Trapelia coarctata]|nr:hypothetical protein [Trapelia coarctata]
MLTPASSTTPLPAPPVPATTSSTPNEPKPTYVNLKDLNLTTPRGWSNSPGDLSVGLYFNEAFKGNKSTMLKTSYKLDTALPLLTDKEGLYIIQGTASGKSSFYVWNEFSGFLGRAKPDTLALGEVLELLEGGIANLPTEFIEVS